MASCHLVHCESSVFKLSQVIIWIKHCVLMSEYAWFCAVLVNKSPFIQFCSMNVTSTQIKCSTAANPHVFINFSHLGAFRFPIFLFSSAMMLSRVPTSASHWATSAGVGSRLITGSQPSGSKAMWLPGLNTSLSNPEAASRLSHLLLLQSYTKLCLDWKEITQWPSYFTKCFNTFWFLSFFTS